MFFSALLNDGITDINWCLPPCINPYQCYPGCEEICCGKILKTNQNREVDYNSYRQLYANQYGNNQILSNYGGYPMQLHEEQYIKKDQYRSTKNGNDFKVKSSDPVYVVYKYIPINVAGSIRQKDDYESFLSNFDMENQQAFCGPFCSYSACLPACHSSCCLPKKI